MIYTITTNPSLDYYLDIENLEIGKLNRSEKEEYDAAGKGVNVSKFLDILNIPSIALGFLGGYNKDFYLDLLSNHLEIQPQFTFIKENTRINVKINSKEETSLNGKGPSIAEEEYNKFSKRLLNVYSNDFVVLSGNIQKELKSRIIDDVKKLIDENVKVVLDTDTDITSIISSSKPYMVKMDSNDIGKNEEDILRIGKEFIAKGIKYFLYSSYEAYSYLIEDGCYYKCSSTIDGGIFFTGISDAMIAGFICCSNKGGNSEECFRYANAVATTVNVFEKKADFSTVNKKFDSLIIERHEF